MVCPASGSGTGSFVRFLRAAVMAKRRQANAYSARSSSVPPHPCTIASRTSRRSGTCPRVSTLRTVDGLILLPDPSAICRRERLPRHTRNAMSSCMNSIGVCAVSGSGRKSRGPLSGNAGGGKASACFLRSLFRAATTSSPNACSSDSWRPVLPPWRLGRCLELLARLPFARRLMPFRVRVADRRHYGRH